MRWRRWLVGLVAAVLFSGSGGLVAKADDRANSEVVRGVVMATLSVEGARQGIIAGMITEPLIPVLSYRYEVKVPADPATGLPTGKRQHSPLVIVKPLDRSSPKLFQALVTGETLKTVVLQVRLADGHLYLLKLTNAFATNIRESMEQNGKPVEEVSFTFQKIEVEYQGEAISVDSWGPFR